MEPVERGVCSSCGEASPLEARACHSCGGSLLATILVGDAVKDARARYQAARSIAALGPPAPSLVPAKEALAKSGTVLAKRVTRHLAARISEVVTAAGGSVVVRSDKPRSTAAGKLWATVGLVVGLVLAAGLGLVLARRPGSALAEKPRLVASPATDAPKALGVRQIAEIGLLGTVALRCPDSVASGFFVEAETVLTNAHAICARGADMEVTFSDGKKLMAHLTRADSKLDLAVLKVPGAKTRHLPIGDAGTAAVGDRVVFIGSPMGLDFTVHEGTVSSLSRSLGGIAFIQLDAKVNPGNSGGPLLDDQGRVIGVVSAKHAEAEGIGLAIPINYLYSNNGRLLEAPAGTEPSAAFQAMAARAKVALEGEPPSLVASGGTLPGLVGASGDQYGNLVVRVLQPAAETPRSFMVAVKVWNGSEAVCTLKADVVDWHSVDQGGTALEITKDALPWARRRRASGVNLYLGKATLSWNGCSAHSPIGLLLELEGADPEAAKLLLQ